MERVALRGWHVVALLGSSLLGAVGGLLGVIAWVGGDPADVARGVMEGRLRGPLLLALFIGTAVGLFAFMVSDVRNREGRGLPGTWYGWCVFGFAVGAAASGFLGWAMR
jgi:hypothetical protein